MTEIILFGQSIKAECPLLARSGQNLSGATRHKPEVDSVVPKAACCSSER